MFVSHVDRHVGIPADEFTAQNLRELGFATFERAQTDESTVAREAILLILVGIPALVRPLEHGFRGLAGKRIAVPAAGKAER